MHKIYYFCNKYGFQIWLLAEKAVILHKFGHVENATKNLFYVNIFGI
jgi:hypothetical protein